MLNEVELSVVVPVYDESLFVVQKALSSVSRQLKSNYELIIIDDNPQRTDLKAFLQDFQSKTKSVFLVFNSVNKGLVYSLNKGLQQAKGKYIARMDADDISLPGRFEAQVAILDGGYDFTASAAIEIDENDDKIGFRKMPFEGVMETPTVFKYGNFIIHPSVMMRRDVVNKLGGYHDIPSAEDFDLWVRILFFHHSRAFLVTDPKVLYRVRANGISLANRLTMDISSNAIKRALNKASSLAEYDELIDQSFNESKKGIKISDWKPFQKYYNYGAREYEVKSRQLKKSPSIKNYFSMVGSLLLFPLTWSYVINAVLRRFHEGEG
ncbi:glycosyltransferase [Lactobacillus paracasei]|uniref:glycosyltransferase n=1 Tax=Lacticaseibacillus paracasei TaxID=1597 RepID=UPI001377EBED|nr:glycosyltransferase [Lacticaseibacillus paracasei]MCZ2766775.1 glycosyltransferase [Lacticaseibacillus paracasei]NCU15747.1 glycosyltransferase [Lacticaseibacillus paracasei]